MDLGLRNQSVVVTGGGSNIGRAIVLALRARRRADHDRRHRSGAGREDRRGSAPRSARRACRSSRTDVTDIAQVQAMFAAATERHGPVEMLVNNVGWDKLMFFTQTTPEFWHKLIQINYVGVLNCTKVALDAMVPRNARRDRLDQLRREPAGRAARGGVRRHEGGGQQLHEDGREGERPLRHPLQRGVPGRDHSRRRKATSAAAACGATRPACSRRSSSRRSRRPCRCARSAGRATSRTRSLFFASPLAAGHVTGQVLSVSGGYSMIG